VSMSHDDWQKVRRALLDKDRAILAERERCARVAEAYGLSARTIELNAQHVTNKVAAAIRAGEEPT